MKHILSIIFLLITTISSAQVVEFHYRNGTYSDVYKHYMNSIDSIVYVPEQHWGGSVSVVNAQQKDDSTLIATISIEVEANADFAAVAIGKDLSQADFEEGNVDYQRVTPGTTTIDIEAPLDESLSAYLYTRNNFNKDVPCFYSCNLSFYKSLGYATLTDNFWWCSSWNVEIQQNMLKPNYFRVVNPFTHIAISEGSEPKDGFSEYLDFHILQPGETYDGVTVTLNDLVGFEDVNIGYYYSSYDADVYALFPGHFQSLKDESYWTYNKVLSYQENGSGLPAQVQLAPYFYLFNVGGWNYTQQDNQIIITFPGVVIRDYSVEVSYSGVIQDSDNKSYAVGNVILGSDVAFAKATVVPGTDAIDDACNGINDGSLENVVEITGSGEVKVPMPADAHTGKYTMAVVTYDANGTAQEKNYVTFKYTDDQTEETWTPKYVGTFIYTQFFGSEEEPYNDEGLVLYQSDQDHTRYKISHIFYDVDFIFTMDDDGTISFDDQFTGYTHSTYGDVYVSDMYAGYPDSFSPSSYSNGTFTFAIGYYVSAGWFGYGSETFTITGNADSAVKAKSSKIARKSLSEKSILCKPLLKKPILKQHSPNVIRKSQTKNVEEIAKRNHLKMAPVE